MAGKPMDQLIFVGFHSQVVALDRDTGELVWQWKSPAGTGYVAVLLDGDRLIASIQGYTYCLAPDDGQVIWENRLAGLGLGVPCLASLRGSSAFQSYLQASSQEQEDASNSAAATHMPTG
jgi:hypothetical protein